MRVATEAMICASVCEHCCGGGESVDFDAYEGKRGPGSEGPGSGTLESSAIGWECPSRVRVEQTIAWVHGKDLHPTYCH